MRIMIFTSKILLSFSLLTVIHEFEMKSFAWKNKFGDLDDYWYTYKARYNKTYCGSKERHRRYSWEKNLAKIYKHNLCAFAGYCSYTLVDNHFADLNAREYFKTLKTFPSTSYFDCMLVGSVPHKPEKIPKRLDWRLEGFNTSIDEQLECMSCYAHSIARGIEGQYWKKTGNLVSLSIQQLVDCTISTGNYGCSGGSLRNTLNYLTNNNGIMREDFYQYNGLQNECRHREDLAVVHISSWKVLPSGDERNLQAAVAKNGPIAACVNASPQTFQLYNDGIYDDPECTSDGMNHAVLIIGFTEKYWIVKNWWGSDWGENGYMRIVKNKNLCGIANYAVYVMF